MAKLNEIQTIEVPCPTCGAEAGKPCVWMTHPEKKGQPFEDKSLHSDRTKEVYRV